MPVFYECQRCTACCRWPGEVRITSEELARLAAHLGLPEPEFIQRYTHLSRHRNCLALIEHPAGHCIFLEGTLCAVQPVKPQQCRDFPNRWSFPGFERECQAVARLVTPEEYEALIIEATGKKPAVATARLLVGIPLNLGGADADG